MSRVSEARSPKKCDNRGYIQRSRLKGVRELLQPTELRSKLGIAEKVTLTIAIGDCISLEDIFEQTDM